MKYKKMLAVTTIATLLISPLTAKASTTSVQELPDGSHYWYSEITYGTEEVVVLPSFPYELAIWENNHFNNLQEKLEWLREGNNASEYAKEVNKFNEQEMVNYLHNLKDNLKTEADFSYQSYLANKSLDN